MIALSMLLLFAPAQGVAEITLGARVAANSWNRLLPGEVINLAGSRSVFAAEHPDEALQRRLREGDVSPTGPLCGSGGVLPGGEAGRVEAEALASVMRDIGAHLPAAGAPHLPPYEHGWPAVDASARGLRMVAEQLGPPKPVRTATVRFNAGRQW